MTTTGDYLLGLSTLPTGTALDHFLAMETGGGSVIVNSGVDVEVVFDSLSVSFDQALIDVELEPLTVEIEVGDPIEVEVADPSYEIEVEPT